MWIGGTSAPPHLDHLGYLRILRDRLVRVMSEQHEIRVQVNGPRPRFTDVAEHLWGRGVDFDSDGDSASPDGSEWTELTVERRQGPAERVDIDRVSERPLA